MSAAMFPRASAGDARNDRLRHAARLCYSQLRFPTSKHRADISDDRFVELRSRDTLSARDTLWADYRAVSVSACLSALRDLVLYVVCLRAEEQMAWIAARRVVAAMQDAIAWICAIRYSPSDAMSQRGPVSAFNPTDTESTISGAVTVRGPFPAFLWPSTIYFGPKPLDSFAIHSKAPNAHANTTGGCA